jgi:hypothetical protein
MKDGDVHRRRRSTAAAAAATCCRRCCFRPTICCPHQHTKETHPHVHTPPGAFAIKPKKARLLVDYNDQRVSSAASGQPASDADRWQAAALVQLASRHTTLTSPLSHLSHLTPHPTPPQKDLSKMINQKNENNLAAHAEQAGGHLKMVKAPPVLAPADAKKKAKAAKAGGQ